MPSLQPKQDAFVITAILQLIHFDRLIAVEIYFLNMCIINVHSLGLFLCALCYLCLLCKTAT